MTVNLNLNPNLNLNLNLDPNRPFLTPPGARLI